MRKPLLFAATIIMAVSAQSQTVRPYEMPTRALTDGAFTQITQAYGNEKHLTVSGYGFVDSEKGLIATAFDDVTDVVFGSENLVYIHAPLGGTQSAYVIGELEEDRKSFTVQYPQVIETFSAKDQNGNMIGYPVFCQVMEGSQEIDENGIPYFTYTPVNDRKLNCIRYTIQEDGSIHMDPPLQEKFETDANGKIQSPKYILSEYMILPANVAGYDDSEDPVLMWLGPGCINVQYNELPADIKRVSYADVTESVLFDNTWMIEDAYGQKTNLVVGFWEDMVYIMGTSALPYIDCLDMFYGKIEGDKVRFPDRQFLGYDQRDHAFIFFMGAKGRWADDYMDYYLTGKDLVMSYDKEKQEMRFIEEDDAIALSTSYKEYGSGFMPYYQPVIKKQNAEDLNAAPVAPKILGWSDMTEKYGVYELGVRILNTNVNGALLLPGAMYYTVYVDDEPYYFDVDRNGLYTDGSQIPYTHNSIDIMDQNNGIRSLGIHATGAKKLGIQSFYRGMDDQLYASEITSVDVSGIDTIEGVEVVSRRYFDIHGREVKNPMPKSLLIEVMGLSDGSVKTNKIIY